MSFTLNDCAHTLFGETSAALYSSIIFWAYCSCVKPSNGMETPAFFSSGVIFTPKDLNNSMLSACVISVPREEYKSVRKLSVAFMYCSTRVAFGSNASILPFSDLNSATVMSLVQHSACAGAMVAPVTGSFTAGLKGTEHLPASSGTARMLVVVCRSHCEWRQT